MSRLGRDPAPAYREALAMAATDAERRYLSRRLTDATSNPAAARLGAPALFWTR